MIEVGSLDGIGSQTLKSRTAWVLGLAYIDELVRTRPLTTDPQGEKVPDPFVPLWLLERTAGWICTWREYLRQETEHDLVLAMRRHENTGRPLGDSGFVKRVGVLLGRNVLPEKPGPKREPKR